MEDTWLYEGGDDALEAFRDNTAVTFPIHNGESLAVRLGVGVSPTMVFVTQTKAKPWFEEGLRSFYFMDELLKIMQGK